MSRSAQDPVSKTMYPKDTSGRASAAHTDSGEEAANGSDGVDSHAIERDSCPTRGEAKLEPASKRRRYSVEKPQDDALLS